VDLEDEQIERLDRTHSGGFDDGRFVQHRDELVALCMTENKSGLTNPARLPRGMGGT
jgi:hypothetical protein